MSLNRRDFLKMNAGLAMGYFLPSCGSGDSDDPKPSTPTIYRPTVNSPLPYFDTDYSACSGVSDSFGGVLMERFLEFPGAFYITDENNRSQEGINVWLYEDRKTLDALLYVTDPQKRFMPRLVSSNYLNSNSVENPQMSFWYNTKIVLEDRNPFEIANGIFVKQIRSGLPEYNQDCSDNYPGKIYLGDWSFNQVKNLNTNLKNASLVLTIIPSPLSGFGASAYSVLSRTGDILDNIDVVTDTISELTPFELDKDKRYSLFYDCPLIGMPGLIFKESCGQNNSVDIKNLFPIQPGNSWTFRSGWSRSTMSVEGLEYVRGKKLVSIVSTTGLKEYYGFQGNSLNYYGFNAPSIGSVLFDPPINIGNDSINVGSSFNTSSKIICVDRPDISGVIDESITYSGREDLVLSNNAPYGDCWNWEEHMNLRLTNGSDVSSANQFAQHWCCENVGKVRTIFDGRTFDLESVNVESLLQNEIVSLEKNSDVNSISGKIVESINKL